MSILAAECKGKIHTFGNSAGGFYRMSPPIPDAGGGKVLLSGVPLGLSEIIQPTTTLDDKRILYIFGSAWNDISVSGILLLGDSKTKGEQASSLLKWYETNRVSAKMAPIQVSIGTSGFSAYVIGLRTDPANPNTNTQTFTITMTTADTS